MVTQPPNLKFCRIKLLNAVKTLAKGTDEAMPRDLVYSSGAINWKGVVSDPDDDQLLSTALGELLKLLHPGLIIQRGDSRTSSGSPV
jgi:hypothetical protein